MKLFYFFLFLTFSNTLSAQEYFNVTLKESSRQNCPGLHSGAIVEENNFWIFVGGRTNGLHGFTPSSAFGPAYASDSLWVYDPTSDLSYKTDLRVMGDTIADAISSSSMQYWKDSNTLYMFGGYGFSHRDNAYITFPTITAINLTCAIDAAINSHSVSPCIRQYTDSFIRVTGANVIKLDSLYYLVFGHVFDGQYQPNIDTNYFRQTYTNEIRRFTLSAAGIKRVVVGATDPNPNHAGKGFKILQRAKIAVSHGILADECARLNEAFNHWIVDCTPFVTVKAAMTLDGKIATASGESKWITGEKARAHGMKLRQGSDAILVGVNTILADDPSLTVRTRMEDGRWKMEKPIRRIVLDSRARTPLTARVVSDEFATLTTIIVGPRAKKNRVTALAKRIKVIIAPTAKAGRASPRTGSSAASPHQIDLKWLLKKLGADNVTSLLVEGGGEVNASFLLGGLAQRVVFFYAPKILGGRDSRKAVAGEGAKSLTEVLQLREVTWRRLGEDLLLTARV